MKNISFLIGSGFSKPGGFPTTSDINRRLHKINASEIYKHTGGDAGFLNGNEDLYSDWTGLEERKFIQEFIEFYCFNVLKDPNKFHYEKFYDCYHEYLSNPNYPEEMVEFFNKFIQNHNIQKKPHDLLYEFNLSYNQLIGHLLEKKFERCHLSKPYHPSCDRFLNLVEALSKKFIVNFHTLNHDLYLESLAYSDSIQTGLDDGFEEFGSPYYGKLLMENERYMVRLSRFTNKFSKPFRLYKLHGSIDRFWFDSNETVDLIRLKYGLGKTDIYKEVIRDRQYEYEFSSLNYYPDFLTGTTYKTRRYSKGRYYPIIFNHFEKNLISSDCLVIIGYGFGDSGINDYIENTFLTNSSKTAFIIDIEKPHTNLLDHENVFYISGGVVDMNIDILLNKIGI